MLLLGSRLERRKSRRALWFALLLALPALACAQAEKPVVGRLVGENLVVLGPAGETFVGAGDSKMVTSGSEIRVRSGEARLELARGGLIRICSPAHFTVLGSGGQCTLALESGRVEAVPSGATRLAIYTAQIVAQPVEIAGEPEQFTLGVDAGGAICVQAAGGAVELEEQLTGKKLVVPQGGEIVLPNGRLAGIREGWGSCRCRLELAQRPSLPPGPAAEAAASQAAPSALPIASEAAPPARRSEHEEYAELPRPVAPAERPTSSAPPPSLTPTAQPIPGQAASPAALPEEHAELARPVAPAERSAASAPPPSLTPTAQPIPSQAASPAALPEERTELARPVAPAERSAASAPPPSLTPTAQPIPGQAASPAALPEERTELAPPVAAARRGTAPAPPEVSAPVWKVIMPPLVFHAGEPSPPSNKPSPAVVQLARAARVQTALVIRGEVTPEAPRKKRGFWSKFGGFFGHLFGRRSRSSS